ncbi:MAG TPA: hypothetical protein VMW35_16600 [Myxococcota bacterium]|jgi:tRNA nucleotidyltransferase (CCA-adding enzyme)|nr:hypothetical protein [Myxococcota bacterium]
MTASRPPGAATAEALLEALPEGEATIVRALVDAAERDGVSLLAVGGPVRDLLLARPLRDVDLIVEPRGGADAAQLARAASLPGAQLLAHDRFGTLRVSTAEGTVDLATVRRETYAYPGALPEVAPGTLEDDLRRRDFTVNALAIPLTAAARDGRGEVVEAERGLADLEAGVLRVLHPRSFHDDPTRALRAARLAGRLGFTLSRSTRSALRDALRDGAFGRVSGDRLRREIEKLFEDASQGLDPSAALRLLSEWHVLAALEPGLTLPSETLAPLRRLGRAIVQPPWPAPRARPWAAGLAIWLAPLDAGLRGRALRRFAIRGSLADRIVGFPKARDAWLRGLGRARGRGAIDAVLAGVGDEEALALHAWASPTARRRVARHMLEDRPRRIPVTGDDLIALGLTGPAVGRALARIRIAFLDGAVKDREDALALARELAGRRGGSRTRKTS